MKSLKCFAVLTALLALSAFTADLKAEPPVPVRTVAPDYPEQLKADGASGIVTITCTIDAQGKVQDLKVVKSTNEAFNENAVAALKQWKFKPAEKDGTAIVAHVTIPIVFRANT